MANCELLNAAKRIAAQRGLSETIVCCPYLATSSCEGVGRQAPGVRIAPACYAIPETVQPDALKTVDLFQKRALITQIGRKPLRGSA